MSDQEVDVVDEKSGQTGGPQQAALNARYDFTSKDFDAEAALRKPGSASHPCQMRQCWTMSASVPPWCQEQQSTCHRPEWLLRYADALDP